MKNVLIRTALQFIVNMNKIKEEIYDNTPASVLFFKAIINTLILNDRQNI